MTRQYVDMRHVGGLTLLSVFNATLLVAVAYMTKLVIEACQSGVTSTIVTNITIAIAMLILYAITLGITNYLISKVSMTSTKAMVTDMHAHLLRTPYSDATRGHSLESLKIVAGDSELAVSTYVALFPEIANMLIKLALGIILMMIISYKITLIAMGIGVIVCLMMLLARRPIKAAHKNSQSAVALSNAYMQETMKNVEVVKMFDMSDYVREGVSERLERVRSAILKMSRLTNTINSMAYLLLEVAFLFVLVYGGVLISQGELDIASFVALVGIIEVVKVPFMRATTVSTNIFTMLASEERVRTIRDIELEQYADDDFDSIVLDHVSYSYDNTLVIDDVSLRLDRGDMLMLSGYSGVGKSTLIRLMLGIIKPTSGEVYLTRGVERIPLEGMILRAGYLPQGLGLWSDTVRANLTYGRDIDDEKIFDALRTAGVYDDIIERGLDYELTEGGNGLSEGQRQRLGIARALLSDSEIIVLDEPFSALDRAIAVEIYARLKALGRTIIISSHDDFVREGADHVLDMGARV